MGMGGPRPLNSITVGAVDDIYVGMHGQSPHEPFPFMKIHFFNDLLIIDFSSIRVHALHISISINVCLKNSWSLLIAESSSFNPGLSPWSQVHCIIFSIVHEATSLMEEWTFFIRISE